MPTDSSDFWLTEPWTYISSCARISVNLDEDFIQITDANLLEWKVPTEPLAFFVEQNICPLGQKIRNQMGHEILVSPWPDRF